MIPESEEFSDVKPPTTPLGPNLKVKKDVKKPAAAKPRSKPKRVMPGTKSSTDQDNLLAHTKAIEALRKAIEAQTSKADALAEFQEEKLKGWMDKESAAALDFKNKNAEREVSAKRKADQLEAESEQRRVRLALEVKEHGISTAKEVLDSEGYVAIREADLTELRDALAQAKQDLTTVEATTTKTVTERLKERHEMAMRTAVLEHDKEVAEKVAINNQQAREIKNLSEQTVELRKDIQKQQDLLAKAFESMSKSNSTTVVEKRT